MYLEQKLIPRGKKLYLVRIENDNESIRVSSYIKDRLGSLFLDVDGQLCSFSSICYRRNRWFNEEERLKAYVHFNNLVSLFRDHDVYGDVT